MKTKYVLVVALIVAACCFSTTASAQTNLNALMKKCETMNDVNMDVVQQRNPKTKKISQIIKTVMIKNNKALIDDFLKAFQADKNDAIQAIESKRNGRIMPSYYQFNVGGVDVSYSLTVKDDGNSGTVSFIQNGE